MRSTSVLTSTPTSSKSGLFRPARFALSSGLLASGVLALAGLGILMPTLFPQSSPDGQAAMANRSGIPLAQVTHVYLDKQPSDTVGNFYFMLGTQMAARGQLLAAEGLLQKSIALLPSNADAHLNYGVVLEGLGKDAEALNMYQKASKIQEDTDDGVNAQTLYTIGLLQDKMGQTESGIGSLKKAMQIEPKNNLIAYDLGVLYSKEEDYENAAHYSKMSLDGLTDFAEGYNNYGYALAHLGRFDEALSAVNHSLTLKPESAAALDSRGFVYHGMQKYSDAVTDYKKALSLDPTIGEIYLHLGESYEKLKDVPNALRSYEQYLQLTPKATNMGEIRGRIAKLKQQDFAHKDSLRTPTLNIPLNHPDKAQPLKSSSNENFNKD